MYYFTNFSSKLLKLRQLLTMDVRFVNSGELPGAGTSTGIEHAIKFKKIGENNKQSFNDYKCIEYLNFNKDSYYNIEVNFLIYKYFKFDILV